jgi:hypothetical protein
MARRLFSDYDYTVRDINGKVSTQCWVGHEEWAKDLFGKLVSNGQGRIETAVLMEIYTKDIIASYTAGQQ